MASATSFKQQCPSCEAMVPIRDPALVGRKIDCPKCKYRFVVEKPGKSTDDEDDTPAPAKNVQKANAGAKADKPAAKGQSAAKGSGVAKGKPAPRRRDEDEDDEEVERPKKKKSGVSMTVILGAGLGVLALILLGVGGVVLLGGGGGTKETPRPLSSGTTPVAPTTPPVVQTQPDKKPDGPPPLAVADVSNLLPNDSEAVVNLQIDKLYGSGFRQAALGTPGAFNENAFKSLFGFPLHDANAKDGLQRVVTALNNTNHWVFTVLRTLKPVNKDQLITSLQLDARPAVNGMTAYSVKRDLDGLSNLLIKANRTHDDLQLCFLDGQTLVFADPAPMQKFLADQGKPKRLSQPTAAAPPPGPFPPGGSTPPGGSVPPGGSTPRPGVPPAPAGSTPPGGSAPPSGVIPPAGITPPGGTAPPPPPVLGSYLTIDPAMKSLFDKIEKPDQPVLFSLVLSAKDPLLDELDLYGKNQMRTLQAAKDIKLDDKVLRDALDQLKDMKLQDAGVHNIGVSITAFTQDKVGGMVAVAMNNETLAKSVQQLTAPLVGRVNSALSGAAPGQPPGGPSPPGGSPPPSFTPPNGSIPPGSSPPGGSFPPSSPSSSFNPSGATGGPVSLNLDKDTLVLSAVLPFKDDAVYQGVEQEVGALMVHLKAASDMISTRSRIHDLAAALQKYLKDKGHFPRGTADRPSSESFVVWEPNQRISWMAELLPYLGDGEFAGLMSDPTKSWQEGPNLQVAGVLIPQFIGRGETDDPPLVPYPGVSQEVAVTNFVGVAGVGMDAAEYLQGHPQAGAFGYDRETKPADVKDGLDKTILLLQVPADFKAPWLAGGGATVRGVSTGPDPVRPFVCIEYQGKRGTFAVMGDGKVRFIPETIDPNVFRALCTIAGGEKIDDLDKIAPVVPGDQAGPAVAAGAPAPPPPAPAPAAVPVK